MSGRSIGDGLDAVELSIVDALAEKIGDIACDYLEAEHVPAARGVELISRAEVLSLASGLSARVEEFGGDVEQLLEQTIGMLRETTRAMALGRRAPEGRA